MKYTSGSIKLMEEHVCMYVCMYTCITCLCGFRFRYV
jgi:hypothetical protein